MTDKTQTGEWKDNLSPHFQPFRDRTAPGMRWGQRDIKLLMGCVLKVTQPVGCRRTLNGHWATDMRGRRLQLDRVLVPVVKWCRFLWGHLCSSTFNRGRKRTFRKCFGRPFCGDKTKWDFFLRKIYVFFVFFYGLCWGQFMFFHCCFIRKCCSGYNVVEHISLSLFQPSYRFCIRWTENW